MVYSEELLQRFLQPSWAGGVAAPDADATEGNPTCGDVVRISLKLSDGVVGEARFEVLGCSVAIAAADAVCELVRGCTATAAELLSLEDIGTLIGIVPEERAGCASAPLGALRSALSQTR